MPWCSVGRLIEGTLFPCLVSLLRLPVRAPRDLPLPCLLNTDSSLVISIDLDAEEERNVGLWNDIIARFPNVKEVLIDLSDLDAYRHICESQLEYVGEEVRQLPEENSPWAVPSEFPPISTLRISGLEEDGAGTETGFEIAALQQLLSQLQLSSLDRLVLELVSPMFPICNPIYLPQNQFSLSSLQEFEIEFHVTVHDGTTSLDLCVSSVLDCRPYPSGLIPSVSR
jgi:hypothetical protein